MLRLGRRPPVGGTALWRCTAEVVLLPHGSDPEGPGLRWHGAATGVLHRPLVGPGLPVQAQGSVGLRDLLQHGRSETPDRMAHRGCLAVPELDRLVRVVVLDPGNLQGAAEGNPVARLLGCGARAQPAHGLPFREEVFRAGQDADGAARNGFRPFVGDPQAGLRIAGKGWRQGVPFGESIIQGGHWGACRHPIQGHPHLFGPPGGLEIHPIGTIREGHLLPGGGANGGKPVLRGVGAAAARRLAVAVLAELVGEVTANRKHPRGKGAQRRLTRGLRRRRWPGCFRQSQQQFATGAGQHLAVQEQGAGQDGRNRLFLVRAITEPGPELLGSRLGRDGALRASTGSIGVGPACGRDACWVFPWNQLHLQDPGRHLETGRSQQGRSPVVRPAGIWQEEQADLGRKAADQGRAVGHPGAADAGSQGEAQADGSGLRIDFHDPAPGIRGLGGAGPQKQTEQQNGGGLAWLMEARRSMAEE